MRTYLLTGVLLCILALGFRAPIVFALGYVWAEILTPQNLAYSVINELPISMMLAVLSAAFVPFAMVRTGLRWNFLLTLLLIYGVWMTATLAWAILPKEAWIRWDPAFKSVVFTFILTQYLSDRKKIEALVWTILLSGLAHTLAVGVKTIAGGTGYGHDVGLAGSNTGYGEGSTLSMFAIYLIPLALFLLRHQQIIPSDKLKRALLYGSITVSLLTSIGTHTRTGLVAITAFLLMMLLTKGKRLQNLALMVLAAGAIYIFANDAWFSRMTTIGDSTESSAMGRVAVWYWTIEFVKTHPFGGSFGAYLASEHEIALGTAEILNVTGKAFHSIYFEVLGTLGYPGMILFLFLILLTFMKLQAISRKTADDPELQWVVDLSRNLRISLFVYLLGGAFIGVAFQSFLYYLIAFVVALEVLVRKEKQCPR